ncbi:MAG: glycosyltransferase family 4 protein [Planctomycetota bacterium]
MIAQPTSFVRRLVARLAVFAILSTVVVVAHTVRWGRRLLGWRRTSGDPRRLLMLGTFYNVGWFRAHVGPLAACGRLDEVIVLSDEPAMMPAVPGTATVTCACPPRWLKRVAGRSVARALWLMVVARRHRPAVLMGYHIMPNALLCLVAARLCGLRAVYQMTGGPVQIVGGGFGSENRLLRYLGGPSRVLEALIFHVVRQFDAVIVRGERAAAFVRDNRLATAIAVLTAGVDTERFSPRVSSVDHAPALGSPGVPPVGNSPHDYDLVTVGRLVECKRPERFVEIVAALLRRRPGTRAAIVGDGPLAGDLRDRARWLGLNGELAFLGRRDDVPEILRRSRLFILTSRNEGVSIALLEAFAAGLPAAAPNVGDLADFVRPDETGMFIDPADVEATAARLVELLDDPERLARMSRAARRTAEQRCSISALAARWEQLLETLQGVPATRKTGETPMSPTKTGETPMLPIHTVTPS